MKFCEAFSSILSSSERFLKVPWYYLIIWGVLMRFLTFQYVLRHSETFRCDHISSE